MKGQESLRHGLSSTMAADHMCYLNLNCLRELKTSAGHGSSAQ